MLYMQHSSTEASFLQKNKGNSGTLHGIFVKLPCSLENPGEFLTDGRKIDDLSNLGLKQTSVYGKSFLKFVCSHVFV